MTDFGLFEFPPGILPYEDAQYDWAKAKNGIVYYKLSFGERPIGYYKWTNKGSGMNIF